MEGAIGLMTTNETNKSLNEDPLGNYEVVITYVARDEDSYCAPNALFTVRGKDRDLTADELDAIAESCRKVATAIRASNAVAIRLRGR